MPIRFDIVKKIVYEKDNSQIVPRSAGYEVQHRRLTGLYELLILLRIILTLNLQTGWIHQDEFSNSIEVVAGDYFDLQVFKSTAFNTSFPTRSMAFLHTTIYGPYLVFNYFLTYYDETGKENVPNPRWIILIPRLFNVLISFLIDYLMIRFCTINRKQQKLVGELNRIDAIKKYNMAKKKSEGLSTEKISEDTVEEDEEIEALFNLDDDKEADEKSFDDTPNDHTIRNVVLGSSQIMLVFATRTHASTLNLLLFAGLLYLVSESFYQSDKFSPILAMYHKVTNPVKKVKLLRRLKSTGYTPIIRLHWITFVIVMGFFNDPEFFLVFGCIPLFFYLQRGITNKHMGMLYFHARVFAFLAYFFIFSIPFILWDSFYHQRVTIEDFRQLNITIDSFVVTPVNYFAAKSSVFKLDIVDVLYQGLKVFTTFICQFNILGIMGLAAFVKEIHDVIFSHWRSKPALDSHWMFLNCSLFLPLILITLQKSRGGSGPFSPFDLIPLIFPLVYMHAHKIPLISRFSSKISFLWFISNIIGIIFWGYLSQGGILTSFLDLSTQLMPIRYNETQVDITFSQMVAIPPTFALVIPLKWKTLLRSDMTVNPSSKVLEKFENGEMPSELYKTVLKLEETSKVRVYHTGVSPLPMSHLERDLSRLIQSREDQIKQSKIVKHNKETLRHRKKYKDQFDIINFLIIPSSYGLEGEMTFQNIKLTRLKTYWNHLFINVWKNMPSDVSSSSSSPWISYGLVLYRMEILKKSSRTSPKNETLENYLEKDKPQSTLQDAFSSIFQFQNGLTDFLCFLVDSLTIFFIFALFTATYLVFLT